MYDSYLMMTTTIAIAIAIDRLVVCLRREIERN